MTKQSDETQDTNNDEPTEVRGHLLTDQQMTEWGNDSVLADPKVVDEEGNERRKANEVGDTTDDTDDTDDTADTTPELDTADPLVELEDPGDFTPTDTSFEVVIYTGEEGKEKPKTVKITSVEQAEELLEQDPNFGSAKNLLDFNRKVTRMESKLENEQADYDKRKSDYEKQSELVDQHNQQIETIANEITYLVNKKKLPIVDAKYATANWNDPTVAKQPGVKEQLALIRYMNKENIERKKLGLSLMGAVDAFNAMQNEESTKKRATAKVDAANERKTAASRVAGTTPALLSTQPKGISVGRGGSLRDLGQSQWD